MPANDVARPRTSASLATSAMELVKRRDAGVDTPRPKQHAPRRQRLATSAMELVGSRDADVDTPRPKQHVPRRQRF
jgi:hypothetical protein